jgi:hypothetical protein
MSTLPAGWYPSPTSNDDEIYWDGSAWTGATRKASEDLPADVAHIESSEIPRTGLLAKGFLARKPKKRTLIVAGVIVVLILGGAGAAIAGVVHSNQVAAQKADAKATAKMEAADKALNAKIAKRAADNSERAKRAAGVLEIEASIKTMAEKDVTDGLIDGPIIDVSCNPVNGGSTDDLTDKTTAFDCFVSDKDNGDGTQSGHFFNATENWSTGEYTYGFGKSNG